MAIPILEFWRKYFEEPDEGLGSSYERIVINQRVLSVARNFRVKRVLEVPVFGFTGVSGINSMDLARQGLDVTLVDDDSERLSLIRDLWATTPWKSKFVSADDFCEMPFDDDSFDLSWNFSALWFVRDLETFLRELTRVTTRAILLCVPNRFGLGYISQKIDSGDALVQKLREWHILPEVIGMIMRRLNWAHVSDGFFDCPPWPDIGMHKERLLEKLGLSGLFPERKREPLTIMNYYRGDDDGFDGRMMKHYWFERRAPWILKRFWAHHRWFLFQPRR